MEGHVGTTGTGTSHIFLDSFGWAGGVGTGGHIAIHPRAGTYIAMASCWLRWGGLERAQKVVLNRPNDGAAAMVFLWDLRARARARAPPHNFCLISVQVIRWHWEELLFTEEFIHQSKMPTGTFCPWFWVYVRWHIFLLYFYVAHVELVLQTYFLAVKNYGLKVPVITFPVMYTPCKMPIMCPWF